MRKPELLAPGGSFASAFHAFEAGADGVYLGMREFSARAAAQNFTLEQLRRIRQLAADRGRKIYVTINTVVREEEFSRLRESLAWLEALRVDGVVLQDLGVVDLVLRDYPGLAVHASTQMGVHNDPGLDVAEEMGIRRVILSRELSFERIRSLRERHPGIQLEVFIHGALCYSFSGACLASWALTGRSGNRGECAQVCRSVFSLEDAEEGASTSRANASTSRANAAEASGSAAQGRLFSTRDLFLGRDVRVLAGIGIDALKIEGRMKSPEYVFNVTKLYRELLDRGEELSDRDYEELVRRADLGFARTKTAGWFHSDRGSRLLEPGAPGHRGAFLANVEETRGRQMTMRLNGDLSLHDGLAYQEGGEHAVFAVLKIVKNGRGVNFARRGDTVTVEVPPGASATMPRAGQEIRQLSSRFLDLPQPRETSFDAYKIPLDLRVTLGSGFLSAAAPGFPVFTRELSVSAAESKKPFFPILSGLLDESGESAFRPGSLAFINETGLPGDGIFVRPSELKKVKNELYQFLDRQFTDRAKTPRGAQPGGSDAFGHPPGDVPDDDLGGTFPEVPGEAPVGTLPLSPAELAACAHRERLGPPAQSPVPFVGGDPAALELAQLADHAGFRWLPLPPVILDPAPWIDAVRRLAERHADGRIAIGLNNLSHLAFASSLSDLGNAWFFADFYLYAANARTLRFLASRVPRLLFACDWLEDERKGTGSPVCGRIPVVRLSDDFSPPLFYSLGCFTRHAVNGGRCEEGCPKDFTGGLRQGKNRFRYCVRDCVTYLFRAG